jgi:hypothetical protein
MDVSSKRARETAALIWTTNFGPALFGVAVAFFLAFLPAIVKLVDLVFAQYQPPYPSFVASLEEFLLGALAVAISASLNYFESQYECNLGRACGILAAFTAVSAVISLVGYFIVHYRGQLIFSAEHNGGGVAFAAAIFLVGVVAVSCLTVLQGRRMKDRHMESENDSE